MELPVVEIGVLLWNLAMNSILVTLKEVGVNVVAYAGDVVIEVRGKYPH